MSEPITSMHTVCTYEAPASELIVIDCTGSLMQGAAISDWQEGGSFSAPFDGALESVELSAPEFILYGDPEGN